MGLLRLLQSMKYRRRPRRMVHAVESSPICYSNGTGASLEDPIVITGAGHDMVGTMAIFSWLVQRHGEMNVEWQMLGKSGHHDGQRDIDIYTIQLRSGEERTYYFDITESYGKWPDLGTH